MTKWSDILPKEALDLSIQLADRAEKERQEGRIIYPPQEKIYAALQYTRPEEVKVCIVGQDPYHTPGAANGLAFSISEGLPLQPSLKNIFKELEDDLDLRPPVSGDLTPWAKQGVLLLNTSLTVYKHQANSCQGWGWKKFTKAVLQAATQLQQPVVFLLWGADAQGLLNSLITKAAVYEDGGHIVRERLCNNAYVLSSHPSPLSYTKPCKGSPAFKGSKPFSTANRLLEEMGSTGIDWRL